jgi:hypothetical protein
LKKKGEQLQDRQGNDVELLLAVSDDSSAGGGLARLVHFQMRPLGLRVEVVALPAPRLESEWMAQGKADAYVVLRRGADAPDVSAYLSAARPGWNLAQVGQADAALDEAETAVDPARAVKGPVTGLAAGAWTRAQRDLVASHAVYPLARARTWIVSRGGVAGPQATGAGAGPLWNAEDWRLSDIA